MEASVMQATFCDGGINAILVSSPAAAAIEPVCVDPIG
jgi:hypothetical protein